MLNTGLGMTLSCVMRGTALSTRVLESTAGTEFAGVKFPAHTFWKGQKWLGLGFFIVYYPVEILMLREWPDSKVPTLPCPREISLDLFYTNSGIAGHNNASFLTY